MTDIKSQAEKDKSLVSAVIKRSDIFGESAGGAGLDDQKVKEVRKRCSVVAERQSSILRDRQRCFVFVVHDRLFVQ